MSQVLTFKSHIDGKNADVSIYTDRIEWKRKGEVSKLKVATGLATVGAGFAAGIRKSGSMEFIPIKNISSASIVRDNARFSLVRVITTGNTIDFRVSHSKAREVAEVIRQLVLGSHPAQTGVPVTPAETAPSAPVVVSAATPPPPPPSAPPEPPAWKPDPSGRHEYRYWNAGWTEHVSDGGVTAVDPMP